jgi:hypothetical protein
MIDVFLLLEILKYLWLGFEIVRYFIHQKREKALLEEVENCKQRLNKLENIVKTLKS